MNEIDREPESPEAQRARLQALTRFFEQGIPFNKHLGMRVRSLSPRRVVLSVPARPEFIGDAVRPALHGGLTAALADAAGGLVCFAALSNPRDRISTIDMRVDYLRPGRTDVDLLCEAWLVRMGNRVGVARMLLFSGTLPAPEMPERREQAVAAAQAVYNVLRR